jgi:hypothetical protein
LQALQVVSSSKQLKKNLKLFENDTMNWNLAPKEVNMAV